MGRSCPNFGQLKSEFSDNFHFQAGGGGGGGEFGGNLGGTYYVCGAFWCEILERDSMENLDTNLLFEQKPACASQIVSYILRLCGN